MEIAAFQKLIHDIYHVHDSNRTVEQNFLWFAEEVGELAEAIRHGTKEDREEEFADVLAWLVSLGNQTGIDVQEAVKKKYEKGCPRCESIPCSCTNEH